MPARAPAIDRTLYPFAGHAFDVGAGIRMHYLDEGRGEPIVMVHGNPTWSFLYRNLVLAFRGQFRCIVPDHIGCGLSDKPPASMYDYSLARRVADLERGFDRAARGRGRGVLRGEGRALRGLDRTLDRTDRGRGDVRADV